MRTKYNIPKEYIVIDKLLYSVMHDDFILYCKHKKDKGERFLLYFDGIEELPIRIESFLSIKR